MVALSYEEKTGKDLEREMRADSELEAAEQRERGLSPEKARYAGQKAFGNATSIQEELREMWGWSEVSHVCCVGDSCSGFWSVPKIAVSIDAYLPYGTNLEEDRAAVLFRLGASLAAAILVVNPMAALRSD